MLELIPKGVESLLLLGAHCDDIEIGCGGALLELAPFLAGARVRWIVFSSDETREREARSAARDFAGDAVELDVRVHRFRNGYFPSVRDEIKDAFEALKREASPDLIFCHTGSDLHQDHRTLAELCWNTFRNHLILEYEVPKYDGDLGNPNFFVPIASHTCARKAELILEHFPSQHDKQWFTDDTFSALARLRGIQCASPSGFAEGFYCRKGVLGFER